MPTINSNNTYSVLTNPTASTTNVIVPGNATVIPLTIKGLSGQTADLQEWQSNTGAVLVKITSAGIVTLAGTTGSVSDVAKSINFNLAQTILQGII